MMKQLLTPAIAAAFGASLLMAQISPMGSSFQQPGWIAAPAGGRVTYPTLQSDAQSGPVTNRPFSATESRKSVQTLADGTHVEDGGSSLFYRDTDGRMRNESKTQAIISTPLADPF